MLILCKQLLRIGCMMVLVMPLLAQAKISVKWDVAGVPSDIKANIESRLNSLIKEFDNAQQISDFLVHSKQEVKDAIIPYGYFSSVVSSKIKRQGERWDVRYDVQLGKPIQITEVTITVLGEGEHDEKIKQAIQNIALKVGDVFVSSSYEQEKEKLLDIASNQGYIKAIYQTNKVLLNTKQRTARIILLLDTQKRYYFGDLSFDPCVYQQAFLQRFNLFQNHPPFSSDALLQYQQQMNDSKYFQHVLVVPQLQKISDDQVPLHASVILPKARRYALGLGYGTFTGPRLTAALDMRRIGNTGQSLTSQVRLSSVLSGFSGKYFIPGRHPLTEEWVMGAHYQQFAPKNGTSRSSIFSVGYIKKWGAWQFHPSFNYLLERYSVFDVSARNSELFYPDLSIQYLKIDNLVNPRFGQSFRLSLQGAGDFLFSSTNFAQLNAKGKLFLTPFSFAHIILQAELGYTIVHDLISLPLTMRFFTGGMTSVRGYPDSSIGPGRYLRVGSVEYRNKLYGNIEGAIFYDVGAASNHIGSPFNRGFGLGLIYQSPIGPVRVYLAQALSKSNRPYQLEFSLGPEF